MSETFEQMIEQLNDDLGKSEGAAVEHVELVDVARERRGWSVTLRLHTGSVRRYRYGSEAQARFFAAVFALGPRMLPAAHTAAAPRRRRVRVAQQAALP